MSRRWIAPLVVACALAAPASASAHARNATVALDYRVELDRPAPGVSVAVLDGDRDLRVRVRGGTLVLRGDLDEPMVRIGPRGAWANRASTTAVAERLVSPGHGWRRLSHRPELVWHEHRLSPPPYADSPTGRVARFVIPGELDGRKVTLSGSFVRVRRPSPWPWLAAAAAAAAAVAGLLLLRPRLRQTAAVLLGAGAGAAALAAFVSFTTADATTGRVAWGQIAVAALFAAGLAAAFVRLRGARRSHLAGVVGAGAAALTLGSLGVFRHGVVVSSLPAPGARALCALALVAGVAALATSFAVKEART
ncbi:MAG TPA: hypothetical protein VF186_04565 [Gaiellaceae bacterium]